MALTYCGVRPDLYRQQLRKQEAETTRLVHANTRALLADLAPPTFNVQLDYDDLPKIEPVNVARSGNRHRVYSKSYKPRRVDNSKPKRKEHRS